MNPEEDGARPTEFSSSTEHQAPFRGARPAFVFLLLVNLFNQVDRYVLAAVVGSITRTFFGEGGFAGREDALSQALDRFRQRVVGSWRRGALWGDEVAWRF